MAKSKRKKPRKLKKVSLIDEKIDWNGSVFPFKGVSELLSKQEETENDYDDDEWTTVSANNTIKINNSLSALMGAYMSDNSDEEMIEELPNASTTTKEPASQKKTEIHSCDTTHNDDDDEPPTELKIVKVPVERLGENTLVGTTKTSAMKSCSNRVNNRSSKKRSKQRLVRIERKNQIIKKTTKAKLESDNKSNKDEFPYKFKRRKVTLLEKLLEKEIIEERNVILQCVRYVVSNNFFQ